jgi:hypothetical protein
MGGDSAGVGGWSLTTRADEKVFLNGPFIMGFTTSFRMGQLLRYAFTPPVYHPDEDLDKYMVVNFIDAVRRCFSSGGYSKKQNEEESGGTFLVGFNGNLYKICDDYQVAKSMDEYAAVGCGADIASGSLYSTIGMPPEERIRIALEAAERFNAGVRRPFVIKKL